MMSPSVATEVPKPYSVAAKKYATRSKTPVSGSASNTLSEPPGLVSP